MPIQSERKPKETVDYRFHEQCSSCIHYYSSTCEIVDGKISADAVCDEWRFKESAKYHDNEFYANEYNESKPKEPE